MTYIGIFFLTDGTTGQKVPQMPVQLSPAFHQAKSQPRMSFAHFWHRHGMAQHFPAQNAYRELTLVCKKFVYVNFSYYFHSCKNLFYPNRFKPFRFHRTNTLFLTHGGVEDRKDVYFIELLNSLSDNSKPIQSRTVVISFLCNKTPLPCDKRSEFWEQSCWQLSFAGCISKRVPCKLPRLLPKNQALFLPLSPN